MQANGITKRRDSRRREAAETGGKNSRRTESEGDQRDKAASRSCLLRPNANPAETGKKDSTLRRIEHMKNITIN
jgi:hypothetical protein